MFLAAFSVATAVMTTPNQTVAFLAPQTPTTPKQQQEQAFPEYVPSLRPPGALSGGWAPLPDLSSPKAQEAIANAPEPPEQKIVVDLKTQTLVAYSGHEKVYGFNCSTGRNGATPKGEFSVRQKARYNRALPKYGSVPIPFSLRLDIVVKGRRHLIAIHAHNSVPRYPASHGCIRLRHADAKKLFDWAVVGIPVSIE